MKVQLIIEVGDNGAVSVNGPITDKVLCYGLLDCARDAIKDYNDKHAGQKIIAPTNGDVRSITRS